MPVIKYSGLSNSTCTDLHSYKQFFVPDPLCGLHNQSEEYSIQISPSAAGSGAPGPPFTFNGVSSISTRDVEEPGNT
jgi:hypothetical protein